VNRHCFRADGDPKMAFETFDKAQEAAEDNFRRRHIRCHAYRCDEHGWHVGGNVPRAERDVTRPEPVLPRQRRRDRIAC